MKVKEHPEDFIVEENPNREFDEYQGEYFVYRAKKISMSTHEMISTLSRLNGNQLRDIKFAGLKDKHAITTQYISSNKELTKAPEKVNLEFAGYTDEPLGLGDLKSNKFTIRIKEVKNTYECAIPNYFDDQRFSKDNVKIGLAIMKGDFMSAAEHFANEYSSCRDKLINQINQPINALQAVPKRLLLIYIHSVQSWLFNEAVAEYVEDNYEVVHSADYVHGTMFFPKELEDEEIPIPGAAQDLGKWDKYYKPLMEEAGISQESFLIRQLPFLTQEGTTRKLRCDIKSKKIKQESSNQYVLELELGPGCYATTCVKGWFS